MTDTLRIGIVSGILHPSYGGPFSVVCRHVEALRARADAHARIFGVVPPGQAAQTRAALPDAALFDATWPKRWFWGAGLGAALRAAADQIDVWHAHMLWDAPVWQVARLAQRTGRPVVITPHGSVAADWRGRAPHKRLYTRALLRPALGPRAALHALNAVEAAALARWSGGQWPIFTVPNGLPRAELVRVDPAPALARWPSLSGRRVLLYLGRLWGEKGLDLLPEAFAQSAPGSPSSPEDDRWDLVIAGPDYRGYGAELRARIAPLTAAGHRIHLVGAVHGAEKRALYSLAELFALPSKGEGQSMALLEAMAAGTPALITPQCHQEDLVAAGGGWSARRDPLEWQTALRALRAWPTPRLRAAGALGQALARTKYSAEAVADALMLHYRSI